MSRKALAKVEPNGHGIIIPKQGELIRNAISGEIEPWAIQTRPGPGNRTLKYIPHGYVRDQLNQVFGPFWSELPVDVKPGCKWDIVEYEIERENPRSHVKERKLVKEVIAATLLRIRIYDTNGNLISEETHPGTGGKIWENNISFTDTLQSAQSEALKRAAFPLGRKFGLQLYYDEDERRADWQEKFAPPEPPKNIAQLLTRLQKEKVSDADFLAATGIELSDVMSDKEVPPLWDKVLEYIEHTIDSDTVG